MPRMGCTDPIKLPREFKAIPEVEITAGNEKNVEELTSQLKEIRSLYGVLPERTPSCSLVRGIVCVLLIAGIAAAIISQIGWTTFSQNFIQFFHNINWLHVGIGVAFFTVLTIGAVIVIRHVMQQKDPITKHDIGKMTGDDHWVPAFYTSDRSKHGSLGYIDKSTLDEDGNGQAFMYIYKDPANHYGVCLAMLATSIPHGVAAIVYNLLRLVIIPFYILVRLALYPVLGYPKKEGERFHLSDIPEEWVKTLFRLAKAAFFTLAVIFAALYAFIDPLNGRKLGSYLEREWNEGVTRAEGFWSVGGPQRLWKGIEGWGARSFLGKNGFYAAGCWQPIAVVFYKNGVLQNEGWSLSKAVDSTKGEIYRIYTKERFAKAYNRIIKELEEYPIKSDLQDFQESVEGF
jgi:hypothetical protein